MCGGVQTKTALPHRSLDTFLRRAVAIHFGLGGSFGRLDFGFLDSGSETGAIASMLFDGSLASPRSVLINSSWYLFEATTSPGQRVATHSLPSHLAHTVFLIIEGLILLARAF